MQYTNPTPDHSVNTSNEHPLKEFFQLLLGIAAVVAIAIFLISLAAEPLARRIPIGYEHKMVSKLDISQVTESSTQDYLQTLVNRVTPLMDLPLEQTITVHYNNDATVNAFATLGGHIIIFRGLLDKLNSEDELVAILTHEIAHIKHRHPIVALSKGLSITTLMSIVSGASGSSAADWLIGGSANLTLMRYSREQERQADKEIVAVLNKLFGHVAGGKALFEVFREMEVQSNRQVQSATIEVFRSHPYSHDRWLNIAKMAKQQNVPVSGSLKPPQWPSNKTVENSSSIAP